MGANFPTEKEFEFHLVKVLHLKLGSTHTSIYSFLSKYFERRPITLVNVIEMMDRLREGTTGLKDQPLSIQTVNDYLYDAQIIARMMGITELDVLKPDKVDQDKVGKHGDYISYKDAVRIVEYNPKRKYAHESEESEELINLKYKACLTFMLYYAPAPCDVCDLQWKNDHGEYLEFRRNKTGIKIFLPMKPKLRALLDKLPRYDHGYIFASPRGRMKEQTLREEIHARAEVLGIKGRITPYSFRYSAETWCWENATDDGLLDLAMMFGHTFEIARKHYADVKGRIKRLDDALTASHPAFMKKANIDVRKRIALKFLTQLFEPSAWQVDLEITPKVHNVRKLHLS